MSTPPLSSYRRAGDLVFLSGEVPRDADGKIPENFGDQVDLVLRKITATLASIELTLADVVSVTVYVSDPKHFADLNTVYRRHFKEPFPSRTTVTAALMLPADVEITVVAAERKAAKA